MSAPIYMKQGPEDYGADRENRNRTDPTEREIIDAWDVAVTIAESSDPHANYSFDDYALIQIGDVFYVTNASGCSCPLPEEVWGVVRRGDRATIEAFIATDGADDATGYASEAWREFQRQVARAGWSVPSPEPRTGSDW